MLLNCSHTKAYIDYFLLLELYLGFDDEGLSFSRLMALYIQNPHKGRCVSAIPGVTCVFWPPEVKNSLEAYGAFDIPNAGWGERIGICQSSDRRLKELTTASRSVIAV